MYEDHVPLLACSGCFCALRMAAVADQDRGQVLTGRLPARLWIWRMEPERLYRLTRRWVDLMWPLCAVIRRIPRIGPSINWRLLVADYSAWGVQGAILKEWAYLDTFDMLGPRYDAPQTLRTMQRWFVEAGLTDVDVRYGHNGIEGRATRPNAAMWSTGSSGPSNDPPSPGGVAG